MVARTWKAAGMAEATGNEATMARSSSASSFKVYTRTGDGGSSCLFNMERRDKDDAVFEALGEVDEVGVAVGIARTFVEEAWRGDGGFGESNLGESSLGETPSALDGLSLRAAFEPLEARLAEIQSRLMDVGSAVATPLDKSSEKKKSRVRFADAHVDVVEAWIDEYDVYLPPLANFILPGGGRAAAFLHQARTAARRAERRSCSRQGRGLRCGGHAVPEPTERLPVHRRAVRRRRAGARENLLQSQGVMMRF